MERHSTNNASWSPHSPLIRSSFSRKHHIRENCAFVLCTCLVSASNTNVGTFVVANLILVTTTLAGVV